MDRPGLPRQLDDRTAHARSAVAAARIMVDRRTALATLGALALTPARVAAQTAPFPIHAGHPPTETAAPALYAIRAGLFDRAGIALTIDKMSSGAAVAAA